jgi:hypothetical protein
MEVDDAVEKSHHQQHQQQHSSSSNKIISKNKDKRYPKQQKSTNVLADTSNKQQQLQQQHQHQHDQDHQVMKKKKSTKNKKKSWKNKNFSNYQNHCHDNNGGGFIDPTTPHHQHQNLSSHHHHQQQRFQIYNDGNTTTMNSNTGSIDYYQNWNHNGMTEMAAGANNDSNNGNGTINNSPSGLLQSNFPPSEGVTGEGGWNGPSAFPFNNYHVYSYDGNYDKILIEDFNSNVNVTSSSLSSSGSASGSASSSPRPPCWMDMIDNSTRIEGIVCRVNGNGGNSNDANNGGEAGVSKMIAIPPFAGASILHQLMIQKESPNSMTMGLQVQQGGGGGQGGPPPPPPNNNNRNRNQEATKTDGGSGGTCMQQQSKSQGNTLNHQAPPFIHYGGIPPPMMMRPAPAPPHVFRGGNGNGNHVPPGFSPHHPHAVSKRNEGDIV